MDWREMVQRCFVDTNELEQAAGEKWLAHNSLDTHLEREMPESGDTVVPTQLVPEAAAVAGACIATSMPRSNPITPLCAFPVVVAPSPALTGVAVPHATTATPTTLCSIVPATPTQL